MLQLSTDPEENKPMAFDVLGVPAFWDGTDVAKFLEDQGWSSLQVLTGKRLEGRKFKWVLKGMPVHDPQNPQKTTWHYRDNFNPNLNFHVAKAFRRWCMFNHPEDGSRWTLRHNLQNLSLRSPTL